MSVKLPKRLRSKKQKYPQDNVLTGVLHKLGLDCCLAAPLDPASMLDIVTWPLEKQTPVDPKDLPKSFLQRLWLFCQDARHICCQTSHPKEYNNRSMEGTSDDFEEANQFAINPLDLVTAVFMSANTFLQYEMAAHMMQCQFAIPLILPNIHAEETSHFLTWPLRGIVTQWWEDCLDGRTIKDGNLATTSMPLVSCVRLGHCSVSKSCVLNHVLGGHKSRAFLHKGMDGGQLPKRLSDGLVEIEWYLPTGDPETDNFPVPVAISNLRGEGSTHQKCLQFLCKASSLVVFFCGALSEKSEQLIHSYKDSGSMLLLVDLSGQERNEETGVSVVTEKLEDNTFPEECVLSGKGLDEKEVADQLIARLKKLLPHKVKLVTLEAAANIASAIGLNVDEGSVCKKAMVTVDEVLKGLDEGSAEFKQKQLPLQGSLWRRLSQIEKEESKQRKEINGIDSKLQREKKGLLAEVSKYRMTRSMKVFTEALFTADQVERAYFLTWIKLRMQIMQTKKQNHLKGQQIQKEVETLDGEMSDTDSFCTDSTFEEDTELQISEEVHEEDQESLQFKEPTEKSEEPTSQHVNVESIDGPVTQMSSNVPEGGFRSKFSHQAEIETCPLESDTNASLCKNVEPNKSDGRPELTSSSIEHISQAENPVSSSIKPVEPSILGLEHFLREMGLIFELTHISPASGSHNVLRLPSLATDLLLYGIPLELMDGDASNIPTQWLSCVFAELQRRLPKEKCRTRILTSFGLHDAKNNEVLSALFNVKFHEGRNRSTKGIYMAALCLPDYLKKDLECDLLLFIDAEGLCSVSPDGNTEVAASDQEMATVAMSLGDILLLNICSYSSCELETTLGFFVSALLRVSERGSPSPLLQFLAQDVGINSILQASQLRRVSEMLRSETDGRGIRNIQTNDLSYIRGPWLNEYSSQPVDSHYCDALLHFKKNLFEVFKKNAATSEASCLPDFMKRIYAILEAVKSDSFSISLLNSDIGLDFSILCTNISHWNNTFLENMENWIMEQTKKILDTKVKVFDAVVQNNLLKELKNEATDEVKSGADNIMSNIEAHLMEKESLKIIAETIRPILRDNLSKLQEKTNEDMINKLDRVSEGHFVSTLLKNFQTLLEKERESLLQALVEKSRSTNIFVEDQDLEEDFEVVWNKAYSVFDFKPSDTDDIPTRVRDLLKENLISRGLQKHLKKLEVNGQNKANQGFQVFEEHYGYLDRLKYKFFESNRKQMLKAQQVAGNIIKEYNQFVADKYEVVADFSDGYVTELLGNIEKALKENTMETRSAFEVDLKVYLCNCAGQDFQTLHNHFAKERELLMCINKTKSKESAEFIYNFRKRDQCKRLAQRFTLMVFKPTVLHYTNQALGQIITEEILAERQEYQSPRAFHKYSLENLVKEDSFESYLEYLLCYDTFRKRKIQDTVQAHFSQSTNIKKLHLQRLQEMVRKIASAVSQTTDNTTGVLINAQQLLERVCDILEREEGVHINREPLIGPLFGFTTEWECFTKCLLECLVTMEAHLVQEFSQTVNIHQILDSLPIQPQNFLFNEVKSCDQRCPVCNAPCDESSQHEVHHTLLHRPVGLQAYVSSSLFSDRYYQGTNHVNEIQDKDKQMLSIACKDICHLDPDWNISINNQFTSNYWRYMSGRFNEHLAEHFKQEPLNIPAEWRNITKEIALQSLK